MSEQAKSPEIPDGSPLHVVEQRIDKLAHEMAMRAAEGVDTLGLVVSRDKLPAILMEIASRAAGQLIAMAASEKGGMPWIDRMMPLVMQKVHYRAIEAADKLAGNPPAPTILVKP